MNNKNNNNGQRLYTIKEVSKLTDVPEYTLRFWEKIFKGHISPVRTNGGHRRYDIETVETIKNVKVFLYEKGYTLSGALNEIKEQKKAVKSFANKVDVEMLVDEIAEILKNRLLQNV
ncbi:MAG TPA: hypothetical protein DHV16_11575 [Nitrospiraceae bacterium]|nr:MAG: hypothetical protein A2X55_11505 [Nitrospirae bacterium GWB2_47_37]HAK87978.1 hypothetical protein [Nitrospiraceae bacterium]HCZ12854.1 hypothetical protein [Nitrospiraceae bacterium]